jgi:ABC-type branched-subunit amino acid transport system ATPase component/branched-subunit amino acid ABC-type transport system permease component
VLAGIVLGILSGLTTGMLAVGIVLVYKSSRFINLAHGQLGALSALLLATFVLDRGMSWWLAFPIAVAVGIALGVASERWIVRPLRRQRRRGLTMVLVTIGLGQILLALTYIPFLAPDPTLLFQKTYPLPFAAHWHVLNADLSGSHIMILLLVPTSVAALAAFLRWTTLGKCMRAAASNAEAAELCGISVDRVNAISWGIAGALSAVTAILMAPSESVFDAGALGPGLLLRSLGAAALGGFVSIPAAMVGGIGIGLVEHLTLAQTHEGTSAQVAVFLAVLAVLFLRGKRISAAADASDDLSEDRPRHRIPPSVANRFVVRHFRLLFGTVGVVAGIVLPNLPYFSRTSNQFLLVMVLVFATAGVGLTILMGWAGQVSFGHFAVLALGAYTAARLGEQHYSILAMMLVAGVVGAVVMAIVGLPALRLRGLTLAVTTLGFAVVAPQWLFAQPWFGAESTLTVHVPTLGLMGFGKLESQRALYYVALTLLVVTAVLAGALRRSVAGRRIVAARDNDRALATFGVRPPRVKLGALALSGFIAGAAGVVWGAAWSDVSPDIVSPAHSLSLLVIPVIGGLGSIPGAIVATLVVYLPTFFVAPQLNPLLGEFGRNLGFQLAVSGAGLALMPLAYPAGLAGLGDELWGRVLRVLDRKHRGDEPEVAADVDADSPPPPPPPSPLTVSDLSLSFGGIRALDEVALEVRPNEIVGLIGPNGAGKTTLINVISGIVETRRGVIRLGGVDITGRAPEARSALGLGRSFQDARLFPGLTVAESVQLAVREGVQAGVVSSLVSAPWARAADARSLAEADRILEMMSLTNWRDALTSELSTGLRRITDLAMQIAARPAVLLLDEPTAGVAQREAEAFAPMLRRIRDELQCSILLVEHDMPLLMTLCDRIYAMDRGRILAEGTPEEIRHDPLVVASYLGTDIAAIDRSGATPSAIEVPS